VAPLKIGKTERRLARAILVSALLPLVVAMFLANSLFSQASAIWFRPEVGEQLDRGVAVYKDYVDAIKGDMRHQTDAIAADESLRVAAIARNVESVEAEMNVVFPRFPQLVALSVESEDGTVLARRDRGKPVDDKKERSLDVLRPLSNEMMIHAVFAIDRKRLDELESTGDVVTTYHQIESSRGDLYNAYLRAFAVLLGLTVLVTLVIGTTLARGVTRRISQLAAALELVGKGDLSVRVPVTGSDELTDLAQTFNRMISEVAQSRARIEFLQRLGAWQEMARRLAHEIKNPLTPIQLAVQECHRKYAGDDKRFRALLDTTLEVVEEEIGTLRRLVGDFSRFARLPRVEMSETDLRKFLVDCKDKLGHLEQGTEEEAPAIVVGGGDADQNVEIDWQIGAGDLPVSIDPQMMRRVVVNLVHNASQAIRDAQLGADKRGRVRISARAEGDGAMLVVEDDGPGIDPANREKIFDPYFTTKADGTGLGLAIVQKIVLEHGGSVEVTKSELLGGAKLVVHLPPSADRTSEALRAARERLGVRAAV
jgi:nitrogen fixation/metabolism regulation signal transduction histidine kinase